LMLSKRLLGGCFPSDIPLLCVARPYSASPAVGYYALHVKQQQELVAEALKAPAIEPGKSKKSARSGS